jgi:hypothetical protein
MTRFLFIIRLIDLRTFVHSIIASLIIIACNKDENNQKTPFEIICPKQETAATCQSQDTINAQFASWLATATFKGGCNASISNNNTGAPNACGGTATVTFTATSSCDSTVICSATFKIVTASPTVFLCPNNKTEPLGQTQTEIDAKFASWLASAILLGGCNTVLNNNNTGAPPNTGGYTLVQFTAASSCEPTKICSASFSVY